MVIILGANDIVNPAAQEDPNSPIAGMLVLEVWESSASDHIKTWSGAVIQALKTHFFTRIIPRMLYGDAKNSLTSCENY